MKTLSDQITSWLPEARQRIAAMTFMPNLEYIGTVQHVGDGVASVVGLPTTRLDELLHFEDGSRGLVFRVDVTNIGVVLLNTGEKLKAGTRVYGSGEIIRIPVGEALLGRVVDGMGLPLDDGPRIEAERYDPIEQPAPAIVDRDLVTQPLMTGVTVIDSMIPLGRGQRELIVGDRKTGKTALAVDAMINQRNTDVICIYCAIGQKSSTVNRVVAAVRRHGAFKRCIFVVGAPEAPPGAQWVTPYAACTMAEFFRDQGLHVLLILDDLTKHAIVYRQLSLLLRKPPGREAYPGDVFYLHARLLERSAKLCERLGGGSLTTLPIAETQAENLTAYIPTNLISITDGQIYMDPKLFYEGQKPAVNVGLSVSRVGGHTQAAALKQLAESLKLEYAQFLELEVFTRFGAMIDERTKTAIEHGRRIRAILIQHEHQPRSLVEQVALLLAVGENRLDQLSAEQVQEFIRGLAEWTTQHCPEILAKIDESGAFSDNDRTELLAATDDYLKLLVPSQATRITDGTTPPATTSNY